MALISLFFQTRAKVGQLDLDASLSESHEASAKLSQSEVEDGTQITDNIVLDPIKLTLQGVVSKTPLGSSALVGSAATAAGGLVSKAVGAKGLVAGALVTGAASLGGLVSNAFGLDGGVDGAKGKSRSPSDVYNYLLELRERRLPIEVVTALKIYKMMAITNVSVPRDKDTTGMLKFTITLEQIRIVTAQTVDLGNLSSLGGKAAETAKLGKQGAAAAAAKVDDDSTVAYKILKGVGGIK